MPYRDDPHSHAEKLEDLIAFYVAAKRDARRMLSRARRQEERNRLRDAAAAGFYRVVWSCTTVVAIATAAAAALMLHWSGDLTQREERFLRDQGVAEREREADDRDLCANDIEYERAVCAEMVEREVDNRMYADSESYRELQHALAAYQLRAAQMPACYPLVTRRGSDPNIITETLPSGSILTYRRDDGDGVEGSCEMRLRSLEQISGRHQDLAERWYDIFRYTAEHGEPSRGQRVWMENRMHMQVPERVRE